jgi:hypothetical protein
METALNKAVKMGNCPYLARTPVTKLRKLSTIPVGRISGLSKAFAPSALLAIAKQCPVMNPAMARTISTSSKCPYATVVDQISAVGTAGSVSSYMDPRAPHNFGINGNLFLIRCESLSFDPCTR